MSIRFLSLFGVISPVLNAVIVVSPSSKPSSVPSSMPGPTATPLRPRPSENFDAQALSQTFIPDSDPTSDPGSNPTSDPSSRQRPDLPASATPSVPTHSSRRASSEAGRESFGLGRASSPPVNVGILSCVTFPNKESNNPSSNSRS